MRSWSSALVPLFTLVASGCAGPPATTLVFDPAATALRTEAGFFDFPYPSDLRRDASGLIDVAGWPVSPAGSLLGGLRGSAAERGGFPTLPVAYFHFTGALAPRDPEVVLPARPDQTLLLLDVDPASPERGRLLPVVAQTLDKDEYLPADVLALAPRPGFVLHPGRSYAFVVLRQLGDAGGQLLGRPAAFADLAEGKIPPLPEGPALQRVYAPLWEALTIAGVAASEVAGATVFTTGDVVLELAQLSDRVLARHTLEITDLHVDPDDGGSHARFCELHGRVRYPQFQRGTPPFSSEGRFELDSEGVPVLQREEEAPIVLTLPTTPMPATGYPLLVYFHGSGGVSNEAVDRGRIEVKDGATRKGEGPSFVIAAHGIASAASALPVNPERLRGATDIAYLNIDNLAAFRDTFRQGAIEQRLFIEALRKLRIPATALAGCAAPTLPAGTTDFSFDPDQLVAQGQSMGGMYTNLIAAVEPRIRAVVPTGAGGFWSYFILRTSLIPGVAQVLGAVFGLDRPPTFLHPSMHLFQTASEPSDPMVYMPRLARRPLPGHPSRPIYEPVGENDIYFPTVLYDAIALAYGNEQAGEEVWPSMQAALALDQRVGILPYPVQQNRRAEDGTAYTGAVVQYRGDGIADPHSIYGQLDEVKYQYGCFLSSFLRSGVAVVPAPAPLGTACPLP